MADPSNVPDRQTDRMGPAKCSRCGNSIASGQYRVVATLCEMKAEDPNKDLAAKQVSSLLHTYCGNCIAGIPVIEMENPWKRTSGPGEEPSPGPSGKDAPSRPLPPEYATSRVPAGSGIADLTTEPSVLNKREPISPQREKLSVYLNDPASRGMRASMRLAAKQWVEGVSMSEIARKMNVDQSTVSRMINGALKLADATR
jgi:hypothetical protein